ncbi:MmcQ/YjbR family DNA-binding protein [Halocola ammonii]
MHIEALRDYCLSKKGVTEGLPFGPDTLVFKVGGKMFALAGLEPFDYINLKCDPEKALELRAEFEGIRPGYHMNKEHWNSVYVDGTVPENLIIELIDLSYALVAKSLSKKAKEEHGLS